MPAIIFLLCSPLICTGSLLGSPMFSISFLHFFLMSPLHSFIGFSFVYPFVSFMFPFVLQWVAFFLLLGPMCFSDGPRFNTLSGSPMWSTGVAVFLQRVAICFLVGSPHASPIKGMQYTNASIPIYIRGETMR